MRASDGGDGGHEFTQEFGGIIRVKDVWAAAAKMEFILKARYEGRGLTVGQGDEQNSFGETVDQGQGFCLASRGKALALEIHSVAGAGFVSEVR